MKKATVDQPGLLLLNQALQPLYINIEAQCLFPGLSSINQTLPTFSPLPTSQHLPPPIERFAYDIQIWHQHRSNFLHSQQKIVSRLAEFDQLWLRIHGGIFTFGASPQPTFFLLTFYPIAAQIFPPSQPWIAFSHLQRREQDIVTLLAQQSSPRDIARQLELSLYTVRGYIKTLRLKARLQNSEHILDAFRPFEECWSEETPAQKRISPFLQ